MGDFMEPKLSKEQFKDLPVTNIMETLIEDQFPVVMQKFPGVCMCKFCLSDIKALALNHLKPRYVASDRGSLYTRLDVSDMMTKVEVLRAMTEAAEIVTQHPRHEDR